MKRIVCMSPCMQIARGQAFEWGSNSAAFFSQHLWLKATHEVAIDAAHVRIIFDGHVHGEAVRMRHFSFDRKLARDSVPSALRGKHFGW